MKDYYRESEVPYEELNKIGITKTQIFSLEKELLESFLSGQLSGMFNIEGVDHSGEQFQFKGKISLFRGEDGSVHINVHPKRNQFKNEIGLSKKEIEDLQLGKVLSKNLNGEKYLLQLDQEINELQKVRVKNINIPPYIAGVKLSAEQKKLLIAGEIIVLKSNSKDINIQIDLLSKNGIKFLDYDHNLKVQYDRINSQVIGTIQTDLNASEYTNSLKKGEGNTMKL